MSIDKFAIEIGGTAFDIESAGEHAFSVAATVDTVPHDGPDMVDAFSGFGLGPPRRFIFHDDLGNAETGFTTPMKQICVMVYRKRELDTVCRRIVLPFLFNKTP